MPLFAPGPGRGVNAPGLPEIPESVFEELLVNALVHRDYLVSASVRLFIFDNRIEIVSPGHLPDNLTVEKILAGNSNIRRGSRPNGPSGTGSQHGGAAYRRAIPTHPGVRWENCGRTPKRRV